MLSVNLAILNTNIITMDKNNPRAEAVAVKNGRIVKVGKTNEIEELIGENTIIIDSQGKTIVPGFIDAHCHPLSIVCRQLFQVDCSPKSISSIDDIIDTLKKRAEKTPKGKWVLGVNYDDTKLVEKRHPTRWDLDKVSAEHPIHLQHNSCHMGVVNTKALEVVKLSKGSTDAVNGKLERDEKTGELTGICTEDTDYIFIPGIGREESLIPLPTEEECERAIQIVFHKYLKAGITSVGEALVSPLEVKVFQRALQDGKLHLRVYMMIHENYLPFIKELGLRTGFGNDMLKIGPIKTFLDGAISARTAYLYKGYKGKPGDCGIVTKNQEELEKIFFKAHEAGFQIAVHANGDRAIDMVLNAYEKILGKIPRENHRHRIEHCTVVNPKILKRIKKLGIVVLPFSTYVWEHGEKMKEYGHRISMMFAHRSFLDYGIPVGGSSDNPCGPFEPLLAIQAMVTRKSSGGETLGPEQKISVEEAIRIYTLGSAYASFEENIKGSIEAGKLADFVMLSNDPTQVSPDTIKDILVEKTILGGNILYERK